MTELDLVQQGVRFTFAWVDATAPEGCKTSHPTIKVQGPKDRPELVEAVRIAVKERTESLRDLGEARKRVWERWKAEGRPVVRRAGRDKNGSVTVHELLPDGVCDTCSGEVVSVRGDVVRIEGIQCHLCLLARFSIIIGAR